MSEGWKCSCGKVNDDEFKRCWYCSKLQAAAANTTAEGFGSSRCSAEDQAESTDAEPCGDRGVMPAAYNGISFERIAEVVRGLKQIDVICEQESYLAIRPRITAAIALLEAVAKQTSAANTK